MSDESPITTQPPSSSQSDQGEDTSRSSWQKTLQKISLKLATGTLVTLCIFLLLYVWGAIFFNGPFSQAGWANAVLASIWLAGMVAIYFTVSTWKLRLIWLLPGFIIVLLPYLMIKPTNDREWEPEFARTGYASIQGDVVTLYNVRNFTHRSRDDFDQRWESRSYHLSKLQGLDYFQSNFYGDTLAHTILSFDFGDDGRVCLSVETRREVGEKFDPFGGLYKIFELQYLFITEQDCIPLRTHVREETVRRYSIKGPIEKIREMFLTSVRIQNELAESPRFYNVLSANCTTSLRAQRPKSDQMPWDLRLLLNGTLDEYLYEEGLLQTEGLSFKELREKAIINEQANSNMHNDAFSERIRAK